MPLDRDVLTCCTEPLEGVWICPALTALDGSVLRHGS
jgi:hypothetical protein